ncbi:acetolactate synthase catalytic subunit [Bradyrhizobium sp. 190]|uniref:acetolactate synthase catalytic subunit n=1 Tax=Bradyrhizobium sp. 190 TaxID=2782658 RepID=UPI001FF7660A|nr:acetolactate synthase catalytic subunit [Bradyrhizobium sp. 190]MCK1517543.1 acetolactate synthase catalytic subunit [Bradyrhizobium sp. 190]
MTVAQRIALALRRHGVKVIFSQNVPPAVILACEAIGIRQLAYRQENMGGAMADGFARVSGQIAVVGAQNGPAATLLVPPFAEACKASVPIVALVQEVARNQLDRNAFQEFDHFALFSSCAKWVRRVISADRIDDFVDAAFVAAGSGRPSPAVLLLPADLLGEKTVTPTRERRSNFGEWPIDRLRPSEAEIRAAALSIAAAKAPVVVAGGGVVSPAAANALAKLQDRAHLPVFTTNMGKGAVDEMHPLSAGVLGALVGPGSLGKHSLPILKEADLVILVATRTNQNGTDGWRQIPSKARVIHIDVDPQEIGRNYEAMRLVGDSASTLEALCGAIDQLDLSLRRDMREGLEHRIAAAWKSFENDRSVFSGSNGTPIRPERVLHELQMRLTPETIVVADASYSSMWVVGQLRGVTTGQRFLTPRGLAGLGWGLPLAIGAKVARPASPVVALVGDGGFAHSWAELETMVRSNVPVVVIVLNNGVLGFQKDGQRVMFGKYISDCHLSPVDHAAIARACGCGGTRVTAPSDLGKALDLALFEQRPWLIEVVTDPSAHPPISLFDGMLGRAGVAA